MAYYSGTAASITALRTALLTHAQADGWVLTGSVLSKAGVYFQIGENATDITCLGCMSTAVIWPAPNVVSIGKIFWASGYPLQVISFPCNYEVFGFAQELFFVVNYDVSNYQWMAFGKSSVPGLPLAGGWCGASFGSAALIQEAAPISITATGGGGSGSSGETGCAALFWGTTQYLAYQRNCFVNSGLDSQGWWYGAMVNVSPIGIRSATPLIGLQPSVWNSEATLLPIRVLKERPSFKASLIADIANARYVRIDNLTPGDVLTLGADRWKVFPWYVKNSAARNGSTAAISHTGTFGWAIRYQGP